MCRARCRAAALGLLATFLGLAPSCRSSAPPPDTANLARRIELLASKDGATFGVVFLDLRDGE
ncbi:MAG TPA: hypothetical protein VGR00_10070, partial [Thermoanaerobaculia bacterium]|nr:hypothetical protein [Thermoanaerobaculia bacterium]